MTTEYVGDSFVIVCRFTRGDVYFCSRRFKGKKEVSREQTGDRKFYDSKVASSKTNNIAENTEVGLIVDYFRNRQGCGRQAALEHGLSYCIVRELGLKLA